ncbi:DUF1801 domain-containing protein [Pseudonocardia parietis]|uniref:YdhG-like domain-containing protein n=1 Tax=Pseudonocardia parietis TaxID=570936 RepID=A0ABS4VYV5_9PSEU|nr:DUF1801 domain-containing protein [Pseudonocardia parietis]MBP2368981.1 hypothetical protein [Pseudonocardia parietis]
MPSWAMAADDRLTKPGPGDVRAYLDTVPDAHRRADAVAALDLIRDVTAAEPVLWGDSMIGFGTQHYTTADGRRREWFAVGLAPRKAALTLYGLTYYDSDQDLLDRLGPHSTGKGCLYVKRLDALDRQVLVELVERSWAANHSTE